MKGLVPTVQPNGYFHNNEWADEFRKLKVRTNGNRGDSKTAREFGAEGIAHVELSICFDEERILSVRQMILSKSKEDRNSADKLLPHQKEDFKKYSKLCH